MTLAELTKVLEDGKPISFTLGLDEVRAMFPSPERHAVESEFRDALSSVGGTLTNPTVDQLSAFCRQHHLSFRLVGNRYLFTRGIHRIIVEGMVESMVKDFQCGDSQS